MFSPATPWFRHSPLFMFCFHPPETYPSRLCLPPHRIFQSPSPCPDHLLYIFCVFDSPPLLHPVLRPDFPNRWSFCLARACLFSGCLRASQDADVLRFPLFICSPQVFISLKLFSQFLKSSSLPPPPPHAISFSDCLVAPLFRWTHARSLQSVRVWCCSIFLEDFSEGLLPPPSFLLFKFIR